MKLRKLTLEGFMRFRDMFEVEFPENQVTLITGENGSGKTSLLDAVCCCLYGKTFRTEGRSTSGFLNLGELVNHEADKAIIRVEFENHGHDYAVQREIKGQTSTGQLLEDGTTKATGRAVYDYVEKVAIGLDWEGFRKSTIILQGEMSSLTNMNPADRKDTFKTLFALTRYDAYETIAKENVRDKQQAAEKIEEVDKLLLAEVAHIPRITKEIKRLDSQIGTLEQETNKLKQELDECRKKKESLEQQYRTFVELKRDLENILKEIQRLEEDLKDTQKQAKELQHLLDELPKLNELYKRLSDLENRQNEMKPLKKKFDELRSTLSRRENEKKGILENIGRSEKRLEREKQRIEELRKQIPTPRAIEEATAKMTEAEENVQRLTKTRTQLETEIRNLDKQMKELQERQSNVKGQDRCPLCLQKIDDPTLIVRHYEEEIQKASSESSQRCEKLTSVQRELEQAQKHYSENKAKMEELGKAAFKKTQLEEAMTELDTISKERTDLDQQAKSIETELGKTQESIKKLDFNEDEYETLDKELSTLRKDKVAERFSIATQAKEQLPRVEEKLEQRNTDLLGAEKKREDCSGKITALGSIEENYLAAKQETDKAQEESARNRESTSEKKAQRTSSREKLSELKEKDKKIKANKQEVEKLQREQDVLETLRTVFKNIPEAVIRRLRPFIEREGTDIINDLSDGEITALNLDEENLNISATTQGEERPIHYFSGGQKTRINMALRVAISRILSKLPSTKEHTLATMNTLFIDEGDFGDLDDHGIRDAVNVIRNLTAEFSRVILISHVDAIKDIFQGQTVEVVKTGPEQSVVRIGLD
jgi:exonuclease SbcC